MIQARLSNEEESLVKAYAGAQGVSVSDLIRTAVFEKIEDEIDLKSYETAMELHVKNPQAVSVAEMRRIING